MSSGDRTKVRWAVTAAEGHSLQTSTLHEHSPGASAPLGATVSSAASTSASSPAHATGVELLLFDRVDDARPARVIRLDPVDQPHLSLLARLRARLCGRADLRLPRRRAVRSRAAACASTPPRCCSTRTAAASPSPTSYGRERRAQARRQRRHGDEERRGRPARPTTGRATRRSQRPLVADDHLRDARARLHPPSQLRRRRGDARHLRRPDREDPLPPGPRHHRGRAAAGVPVRRAGLPGRAWSTTGATQPVSFFAPHQAYSSRPDPLGPVDEFRDMVKALHRAGIEVILDVVFNHTAEGDARRADALLPRPGQPRLLHPRRRTRPATPTTAAAATRSTPTTRSSAG